jgi:hypothetical protein
MAPTPRVLGEWPSWFQEAGGGGWRGGGRFGPPHHGHSTFYPVTQGPRAPARIPGTARRHAAPGADTARRPGITPGKTSVIGGSRWIASAFDKLVELIVRGAPRPRQADAMGITPAQERPGMRGARDCAILASDEIF